MTLSLPKGHSFGSGHYDPEIVDGSSADYSSRYLNDSEPEEDAMMRTSPSSDPDGQKGAVEGDRPSDVPQMGNPHDDGIDEEGLPDDPIGIAEDVEGANEDETQG